MIPIGKPGKIVGGPTETFFPWPLDEGWFVLVEDKTGTDGCYLVRFENPGDNGRYLLSVKDSKALQRHFDRVGWMVEWAS